MRRAPGRLSRLLASVLAFLTLTFGLVAVTASPAAAYDGRVPDGRNGSAYDEVRAMYWHGLGRDPDPAGFANYTRFVDENPRWGVLDASYRILTSTEARNKWRNDPATLTGMLYAALLNRPPDRGGFEAYKGAIIERGLNWSVTQMMGSHEYQARLSRMTVNPNYTATVYGWEDAENLAKKEFLSRAESSAIACGVNFGIRQSIAQLQRIPHPLTMSIGLVAQTTNSLMFLSGADGTCGAAYAFMRSYLEVGKVIDGSRYNPVFMQWTVKDPEKFSRQRPFTIRIGRNPTDWTGFSGKSW